MDRLDQRAHPARSSASLTSAPLTSAPLTSASLTSAPLTSASHPAQSTGPRALELGVPHPMGFGCTRVGGGDEVALQRSARGVDFNRRRWALGMFSPFHSTPAACTQNAEVPPKG